MKLQPGIEQLIHHWGEMGSRWGISRSVAQTHALLYFSAKPMPADEIVEVLGIARSNVSLCLKELQSWGVIRVVHHKGDRRDHFESIQDVWRLFEVLLDERKRREVDPTLKMLRDVSVHLEEDKSVDAVSRQRVSEMKDCFEQMDAWFGEIRRLPLPLRVRLVKYAGRLRKWLE